MKTNEMLTVKQLKDYCKKYGYKYKLNERGKYILFRFYTEMFCYNWVCESTQPVSEDLHLYLAEKRNLNTDTITRNTGKTDAGIILERLNDNI